MKEELKEELKVVEKLTDFELKYCKDCPYWVLQPVPNTDYWEHECTLSRYRWVAWTPCHPEGWGDRKGV